MFLILCGSQENFVTLKLLILKPSNILCRSHPLVAIDGCTLAGRRWLKHAF